jgi:hypothetical protein
MSSKLFSTADLIILKNTLQKSSSEDLGLGTIIAIEATTKNKLDINK